MNIWFGKLKPAIAPGGGALSLHLDLEMCFYMRLEIEMCLIQKLNISVIFELICRD